MRTDFRPTGARRRPIDPLTFRTLRLSRILRADDSRNLDGVIPLRRALLWVGVWVGITVGIVLFFRYGRLLSPLLG